MSVVKAEILIIGAGLTGLTLAYLLKKQNFNVVIVEARDRSGGRVHSKKGIANSSIELGATWLAGQHNVLWNLIDTLNLKTFEQKLGETAFYEPLSTSPHQLVRLPENNDPSFRIVGGTSSLIDALSKNLNQDNVYYNEQILSVTEGKEILTLKTHSNSYVAKHVVSTLPPNLLVNTMDFQPKLPENFMAIAKNTHTWMGESIKVGLTYEKPFWRNKGMSGTIFSNVGPIPEMYDHTNYEETSYSLKGFLNGAYESVKREERIEMVMQQMEKYYGMQARKYISYEETLWCQEPYTYSPYNAQVLPHQNNGAHIYQLPLMNGKLSVAGAETANAFPGYMEGAVRSAEMIYDRLVANPQMLKGEIVR
ncbi:MAG: monoamine oxidase [Gammaproteobacteria bacterium]|jgi:monoamine oxidase